MATPENSIKTNIQLFRECDEFSERFFRCVARPNALQQIGLWNFNDQFATSKEFGYFIWDNNISDLVPFFTRDYFAENWNAIVSTLKVAGTFNSYITIIKSALGDDTVITFASPEPSHLQITISEPTGVFRFGAQTGGELLPVIPDQTQYPDSVLVFSKSLGGLTITQTLAMIDLLNVSGVFIEVFFAN